MSNPDQSSKPTANDADSGSGRRSRAMMNQTTRAALVAAARASFAAHGYAASSMDAICATAGLTRGALYHHFGGKEGLLAAVVQQLDEEITARMDAIWAGARDPWSGFVACCEAYLECALDPEVQQLLLRDAPAVLSKQRQQAGAAGAMVSTREALLTLIASGHARPGPTEPLAWMINGAIDELAQWIAASPAPGSAYHEARAALQILLDGLASGTQDR